MTTERIWECKVGGQADFFESGADSPMRRAVAKAFREITGRDPEFTFSGWSAQLTEAERAVVENRMPKRCEIDHPHHYECKHCHISPPGLHPSEQPTLETAVLQRPCSRCGKPVYCTDASMAATVAYCSIECAD